MPTRIYSNEVVQEATYKDFLSLGFREKELDGYLEKDMPDTQVLLPPPPDEGSFEWKLDVDLCHLHLNASEVRKEQAKRDAILRFPWALDAFNPLVDNKTHPERTPSLYKILRKTSVDGGRSTTAAKQHFQRFRPFMVNHLPTLTPGDEEVLKLDGSYPSGHTAIGWIWALILNDLFPDRSQAIMERGRQFGISRMVCNVHWYSDVVAGRICGDAVTASLYGNPEFLNDLFCAKRELASLAA